MNWGALFGGVVEGAKLARDIVAAGHDAPRVIQRMRTGEHWRQQVATDVEATIDEHAPATQPSQRLADDGASFYGPLEDATDEQLAAELRRRMR